MKNETIITEQILSLMSPSTLAQFAADLSIAPNSAQLRRLVIRELVINCGAVDAEAHLVEAGVTIGEDYRQILSK